MNLRHYRQLFGSPFLIALLVLYLPQTWVFWVAAVHPEKFRGAWLAMFPVMPGGFIAAVLQSLFRNQFQEDIPNPVLLLIALVFTILMIAILTRIGSRGKGFQIAAIVLGSGYSIIAALGLHAAFRM